MTETATTPRPTAAAVAWPRRRAVLLHLGLTLAAAAAATALLLYWFSPTYFRAAGGARLAAMLAGVALVTGPLLTWVVYKPGKRGLRFDLACILLVQSAALGFGLFVAAESRPVFLLAAVDRLELVSAREVADADLAQGSEPRFRHRAWSGPVLASVEAPNDIDEYNALSLSAMSGRDLKNLPKYYRDYASHAGLLLSRARPLAALYGEDAARRRAVERWLADRGLPSENVVWLPLSTSRGDLTALLDRREARFLGSLDIEPRW